MALSLLKACRPHQWVKNLFVAAPLIFARRMDDGGAVRHTGMAVAAFCLLSSAVYLLNDILDVDKDRAHPTKRLRAIAAGKLSVPAARIAAVSFAVVALSMGIYLGALFALVALAYLSLNIGYSLALKRIPFVDVACIALGFLLRVLGGAVAIPVSPSGWLLSCTLLLAGFLGFGKRAHELRVGGESKAAQRDVLDRYGANALRRLMITLAVLTLGTYGAYTQSAHALSFFGTRSLALTLPFVGFGIFRFLWITTRKMDAESPTDSMLRDRAFVANLVLYGVTIVVIIYRS